MNIITIDAGQYSVKFLHGKFEQKKLNIFDHHEVVIADVLSQFPEDATLEEIQHTIVEQYLKQSHFDGRLVMQFPSTALTTRFLDIPVTSKKKADLMVPFQLDENLPYPTSKAHFAKTLIKREGGFKANVYVSEAEYFDSFYNGLKNHHIIPTLLTCEHSAIQSYIDQKKIEGNFCILDIGHKTSKAYFFSNQDLNSSHVSFTAGANLDEVISMTYQIPLDEAVLYKHENCFLLTEDQIAQVESDQAEFAKLMRTTFMPLIHDINRWMLGHRLATSMPIEKVFITGGTTNITNIENFLMSELGVPVEHLPHRNLMKQVGEKDSHSFSLSYIFALTQKAKFTPVNFLIKNYASNTSAGIPLTASTFVLTRTWTFCLILALLLIGEKHILLNAKEMVLDKTILTELKDDSLELKKSTINQYRKAPERILNELKRKEKDIANEVKSITAASLVDGMTPLTKLAASVPKNDKISLIQFNSDSYAAKAVFKSEEIRELEGLKKTLDGSELLNIKTELKRETMLLEVSYDK
ncbi:hypothetical protein M899_2195 [Bacteriovorax sp. BSW11_IV]|uniref:hypothetical protein n=1 Tax=Bacteriovorax sp. BSW11_IV TaxID=1353529 RepID=UPI00038A4EA3|nr:hypothetical protein [Bacteriovorax sp. BSW11_IV]EQC47812.1 hypothetical protein M899_2195 [Bacteriovorax sp. BSW11_IV]